MINEKKTIEEITRQLIKEIGENPNREGLIKTPKRVAKAWEFISKGYKQDIEDIINNPPAKRTILGFSENIR